jgi:hypothetical protein
MSVQVCVCCCHPGDLECIRNNFTQLVVVTGTIVNTSGNATLFCNCAGDNVYVLDFEPQFQTVTLGCNNPAILWLDSRIVFQVSQAAGYDQEAQAHKILRFDLRIEYYFDAPPESGAEPFWDLAFTGANSSGLSELCEPCEQFLAREYSGTREWGLVRTNLTFPCVNQVFDYYLQ